jgi:hypothetical protein
MTELAKEKDSDKRDLLQTEMNEDEENSDSMAFLPASIGWPCSLEDDDHTSGFPCFSLVMQVDLPPFLGTCTDMNHFVSTMGGLPARVTAELTEMLYKTTKNVVSLPVSMLMPVPENLTEFDRMQKFTPGENSLDAYCSAGFLSKQLDRMKSVVVATDDPQHKVDLYNEYISCCARQGVSIILNGDIRSSSTQFAVKYIEMTKEIVCGDLRMLVDDVMGELRDLDGSLASEAVWGDDTESYLYWRRCSPSAFIEKNFCVEAMLQRHNLDFFHLTPQNLKITNEVSLSSLMYRIGGSNGFTYIGMPTVVIDAASKLRVKTNYNGIDQPETRKRPSAGLDLGREVNDTRRQSHESYIEGWTQTQDDQKVGSSLLNKRLNVYKVVIHDGVCARRRTRAIRLLLLLLLLLGGGYCGG